LEIRGTNERKIERWIADLEIAGQKSLAAFLLFLLLPLLLPLTLITCCYIAAILQNFKQLFGGCFKITHTVLRPDGVPQSTRCHFCL
jgi:hypothetical protein